ncbi:MAG: hypothetical protein R2864_15435 [Syntrophotaleaceae bacterium]
MALRGYQHQPGLSGVMAKSRLLPVAILYQQRRCNPFCNATSSTACNPFRYPIATNEAPESPHSNPIKNICRHLAQDQSGDSQILSSFLWILSLEQQRKYSGGPAGTGEVDLLFGFSDWKRIKPAGCAPPGALLFFQANKK